MPLETLENGKSFFEQRNKINEVITEVNELTPVAKADPNLTTEQVAEELKAVAHYNEPMCGKISFDKPIRFVIMGASIMNGVFSNDERKELFKSQLTSRGILVRDVEEYATSGHTSTNTLTVLPTVISDYAGAEAQTVVILHIGGNDISSNGPYPGGATILDANYRQIIGDLQTAGFTVMPCSITYRIPPASNPSAPYNERLIIPAITELTPEALRLSGRPIVDLYRFTLVTPDIHQVDGIHYTADGYANLANFIGGSLTDVLLTEAQTTPIVNNVIIDFSGSNKSYDFAVFNNGASSKITSIPDSVGLFVEDMSVSIQGFNPFTNNGGTLFGGAGYSLDRDELTKDSIFIAHPGFGGDNGETGIISFAGSSIEPLEKYTVNIMASRNVAEDGLRYGLYTCGGITKELSAASDGLLSPPIVSFTSVTGSQLLASGITVARRDPELSSFAYVNGIQIVKE